MKRIIVLVAVLAFLVGCAPSTKTDAQIVRKFCHENYSTCKVVYLNSYNEETITNRKDKNIVYVEKVVSTSHGNHGYDLEGYYISYNKWVWFGNKVTSYVIYNPYTNYCDDVVAVVDNEKIRF